eukprot:11156355-Lingulodinium_polyedra.AAC.1
MVNLTKDARGMASRIDDNDRDVKERFVTAFLAVGSRTTASGLDIEGQEFGSVHRGHRQGIGVQE